MASDQDPLLLLRQSIAAGSVIIPTSSSEPSSSPPEASLSQASHLAFTSPTPAVLPIDAPTRFEIGGRAVDLRSIYFAWLNREVAIPEYNDAATKLNEALAGREVHRFPFVERVDLITWLEGASDESDHIKPLAGDAKAAAAPAAHKAPAARAGAGKGSLDPRLAIIYSGERRMGDRNSVLRGIKPTDFSHVRKLAAPFMSKKPAAAGKSLSSNPALAMNPKAPQRRPDPIILLSPSASSLLRMSNVKSFLESGRYMPPDSTSAAAGASMLHISRTMKAVDPSRPMRFILVEGPEQFKPEYWNRVVAVFTTGQTWQFKNYKWSHPPELFRHVLGIHLGWRGDDAPDVVRSWGHRVMSAGVEKWRDGAPESSRWRDREVVEKIWKAIEDNMRGKGWRRDAAPTSI